MDAIEAIHTTRSRQDASPWVLDADSSGCFDNMDQEPLLATLPVCTTTLRQWLQAGVVAVGVFSPTDPGTPQGGVIAPLLAHVALDGMERLCDAEDADGRPKPPAKSQGITKGVAVIRYADDFVRTAPTRDVLETYARPQLETIAPGTRCGTARRKNPECAPDRRVELPWLPRQAIREQGAIADRPTEGKSPQARAGNTILPGRT